MDRRAFLSLGQSQTLEQTANGDRIQQGNRTNSGLAPYTGGWTSSQVKHLLRRLMFGATQADVNYLLGLTPSQAVDELLWQSTAPAPPINNYNGYQGFVDPNVPLGQVCINEPFDLNSEQMRLLAVKAWWKRGMMEQERNIGEKMILFWHNHLAVQVSEVFISAFAYRYVETLRTHALGNFKDLVRAITIDPAMLNYLSGQYNNVFAPDENYARELQELFCIGADPNHYTEDDVQAAARVLTGWTVDYNTNSALFVPILHDSQPKQFSAFYNNTIIPGQAGMAGAGELDLLLDMIFAKDEVASFVCRKLYRFFVYDKIDATTETLVIEPLAQIFRSNNYEILPVLEALFKSEHFFDTVNYGAMMKTPTDYWMGLWREFQLQLPAPGTLDEFGYLVIWEYLSSVIQQSIGDPPNVAGWPAYYQSPQYDKSWITMLTLPVRAQITDSLLFFGFSYDTFMEQIDTITFSMQFPNVADPVLLVEDALAHFYHIDVSQAVKDQLRSILLSGQAQNYYWTTAWNLHIAYPNDATYRLIVETRLQLFYQYILQLEEYQLL